jgi:hypothetical protein
MFNGETAEMTADTGLGGFDTEGRRIAESFCGLPIFNNQLLARLAEEIDAAIERAWRDGLMVGIQTNQEMANRLRALHARGRRNL